MKKKPSFAVSDGKLVLTLQPVEEGGNVITAPLDPQLITEAETLEEAFENARDAAKMLRAARRKLGSKIKMPPVLVSNRQTGSLS